MSDGISGKRRSAIEIVHDTLSVCNNGRVNKTAIMYRSNLSYRQMGRYLDLLRERELIQVDDRGGYQISEAGEKTLRRVFSVIQSIRELQKELDPEWSPNGRASKAA